MVTPRCIMLSLMGCGLLALGVLGAYTDWVPAQLQVQDERLNRVLLAIGAATLACGAASFFNSRRGRTGSRVR